MSNTIIPKVTSGVGSSQGRRPTMEDAHVMIDELKVAYPDISFPSISNDSASIWGVYDGHGGKQVAIMAEQLLVKILVNNTDFASGNIESALKNAFIKTDEQICTTSKRSGVRSGSTAVVSLLLGNQLWIANIGDSEAVIGRLKHDDPTEDEREQQQHFEKQQQLTNPISPNMKSDATETASDVNIPKSAHRAILLSRKHKPLHADEKLRINQAGGRVLFGRVEGSLAVSRSFGDIDYKYPDNEGEADFVIAEPFIAKHELISRDQFLIVACDGLWDVMSYQQAVDFVSKMRDVGKDASEIANELVAKAIADGSMDNVTVIVVFFPSTLN